MKNITSFNDFKSLKEAKEFVNDTGWNDSLLGKAINGLFSSIGNLFKFGYVGGSYIYLKNQITKEYLKGVILWADDNNIDLKTGEKLKDNKPVVNNNLQTEPIDKPTNAEPVVNKPVSNTDDSEHIVTDDETKSDDWTIVDYNKPMSFDIKNINPLLNDVNILQSSIDSIQKKKSKTPADITAINNYNKKLQDKKTELLKYTDTLKQLVVDKNSKIGKISYQIEELNKKIKDIYDSNISADEKTKQKTELYDKKDSLYSDTQKLRSEVNKINNVLKTITNLSNPTTNKNLLFESNAGSLFKKDVKNELTDNIKNTDIKSINFAKLAKIINKDEATKKVDVNKVYSYHLAAEKLYTEDDKINKKFELSWKKKLAEVKSEFKDLLLVEKLDPLSPNFIVNNKSVDVKKYSEENAKLITSLEIANETTQRIKSFGLDDKTWSTTDIMNTNSDLIFLFTIKWNYRSKKKTEYKSILAVKHIKMGDYSTFAVIDTFSSDFVKTFNIEKNITTPNMGDADFKKFVFGNTYVTDAGTFDVNKIKDKMTFFIIPKLRLPVSNLQEKNETYIVNILKIDGKLDLFVPNLSVSNKIETKNIKITEELKNIETDTINVIDIDLYSTYNIKNSDFINSADIDPNEITKYASDLKTYFDKIIKK